jgi:hypothetical protein
MIKKRASLNESLVQLIVAAVILAFLLLFLFKILGLLDNSSNCQKDGDSLKKAIDELMESKKPYDYIAVPITCKGYIINYDSKEFKLNKNIGAQVEGPATSSEFPPAGNDEGTENKKYQIKEDFYFKINNPLSKPEECVGKQCLCMYNKDDQRCFNFNEKIIFTAPYADLSKDIKPSKKGSFSAKKGFIAEYANYVPFSLGEKSGSAFGIDLSKLMLPTVLDLGSSKGDINSDGNINLRVLYIYKFSLENRNYLLFYFKNSSKEQYIDNKILDLISRIKNQKNDRIKKIKNNIKEASENNNIENLIKYCDEYLKAVKKGGWPEDCQKIKECEFGEGCKVNSDCVCISNQGKQFCKQGSYCYKVLGCMNQEATDAIVCGE